VHPLPSRQEATPRKGGETGRPRSGGIFLRALKDREGCDAGGETGISNRALFAGRRRSTAIGLADGNRDVGSKRTAPAISAFSLDLERCQSVLFS
jgi:hypothetical protein